MEIETTSYYQFSKGHAYSVFVKFEDLELERSLVDSLKELGFDKVEKNDLGSLQIIPNKTCVLKINKANFKTAKHFNSLGPGHIQGQESFSATATSDVYCYKGVGVLVMPHRGVIWEMAVRQKDDTSNEIFVMLTRYLGFALAKQGVLGLWGVPIKEGLVLMRPLKANFESVIIDLQRGVMITKDHVWPIDSEFKILRLDRDLHKTQKYMTKEELLGLLSVHTTYMAYSALPTELKNVLREIAQTTQGVIYPEQNFIPRPDLQAS